MRPIDETARTAIELLQHGDQDARLIGDVTVGEMLTVVADVARLTEALRIANLWRERHCRESGLNAQQSQKNWAEAKRLREQRDAARIMAYNLAGEADPNLLRRYEWDDTEASWSAEEAAERGEGR